MIALRDVREIGMFTADSSQERLNYRLQSLDTKVVSEP